MPAFKPFLQYFATESDTALCQDYQEYEFVECLSEEIQIIDLFTHCIKLQHRQPKLCGSSLDFEFIREYMKINKIRLKFQFWTKIKRLPNGSRDEETVNNKTQTQGKSFIFLFLSKIGI